MAIFSEDDVFSSVDDDDVAVNADNELFVGTIQPFSSTERWQIWCGWVIVDYCCAITNLFSPCPLLMAAKSSIFVYSQRQRFSARVPLR